MDNPVLFPDLEEPSKQVPDAPVGPFASVAIERGIDRTLDYSIPAALVPSVRAGQRVKVPLGRKSRPTFGYVVEIHAETERPQVKPVLAIDDSRVLLTPTLMQLAWWMSGYYCCP